MIIQCQCQKQLHSSEGNYLLDVDFSLENNEILALTGSSGSGKTTLLRLLAGLEVPDQGLITSNGSIWVDSSKKINLAPQKRKVGMVFQNYALFPNMSIKDNLTYALAPGMSQSRVEDMLNILDLAALANKFPYELSGGQQQRVALGRAIIPKPTVLLLDEPLSALDQDFRKQMQIYLLRLHQEYDFSMIIVSHDQQEIYTLAHRIAILEQGKMSIQATKPIQEWPQTSNQNLELSGNIIEIKKESIVVMIGNNLLELPTTSNHEIGQHVKVLFSTNNKAPSVQH